jgi:hypothetical protein
VVLEIVAPNEPHIRNKINTNCTIIIVFFLYNYCKNTKNILKNEEKLYFINKLKKVLNIIQLNFLKQKSPPLKTMGIRQKLNVPLS